MSFEEFFHATFFFQIPGTWLAFVDAHRYPCLSLSWVRYTITNTMKTFDPKAPSRYYFGSEWDTSIKLVLCIPSARVTYGSPYQTRLPYMFRSNPAAQCISPRFPRTAVRSIFNLLHFLGACPTNRGRQLTGVSKVKYKILRRLGNSKSCGNDGTSGASVSPCECQGIEILNILETPEVSNTTAL